MSDSKKEIIDRWLRDVYHEDNSVCMRALTWADELVWEKPFAFKNEILEALSHALRREDIAVRFWAAISVSDYIEWLGEIDPEYKSTITEALLEGMQRSNTDEDWPFIGALKNIGGIAIEKMLEVKKKDVNHQLK
ncbi:hypothetical protein HYR99_26725 [Candidatus Poribacteria bacterium]|nr:hypothetical protein [Candidatus Poribacteria bacterium]